jgi:c-di-GMP-related signal transduction protein
MDKKKLIINLLKDHLINARLINGLKALGFQSEDYHLHLSDTIFELLEIDDKDDLFESYLEWCTQLTEKDLLKDVDLLNIYANGMYEMLLSESKPGNKRS